MLARSARLRPSTFLRLCDLDHVSNCIASEGGNLTMERVRAHFEITWVIFVFGSLSVFCASMRACRLVPPPEMRTTMLYGLSDILDV